GAIGADAGFPQVVGEVAGRVAAGRVDHEDVDRRFRGREHALRVTRQQDALDAGAEANAGRGWAAQLLGQPVVTATTPDCVLGRLERAGRELERRAGVVVEAAHEPGLDGEVDAKRGEARLHAVEV